MRNFIARGRSLLCLLLCVSLPALAGPHPSLFFEAAQVEGLRQKAQSTHQAIYQPLLKGTTDYLDTTLSSSGTITWKGTGNTRQIGDRREIGNLLVVFAFVSQVSTDSRYFELAKGWLLTVSSWGNLDLDGTHDLMQAHLLGGLAVAYDLLAPRLTSAEATKVRATLQQNATDLARASKGGTWWADEYLQNHNWINHAAIGLTALATRGELPEATTQPWLDLSVSNARKVKQMMDLITDGTYHEGTGYLLYGLSWYLPFVSALKRTTSIDVGDLGLVKHFPRAFAYSQLPERPSQYLLMHGDFYGFSPDMGLMPLRYAATRYRDPVAQATADTWMRGTSASTYAPELNQRVFEFLFYDPTVSSTNLSTLPLDWYGDNQQTAVFRSGWGKGSLLFALKNGPYGGMAGWKWLQSGMEPRGTLNFGHDHADDNGFYLYGNGSWLAPEAAGYYIGHASSPGPAANQTVFHNSLTIDGVGQLGEGVRERSDSAAAYSWYSGRKGGIPFFGSSEHFGYTIGDGSTLYAATTGLRRWDRHALFLDRRWVVLRDVVQATKSHVYRWSCHFMNGATREGSWLHGRGENRQALGVAVVAPASFDATFTQQRPAQIQRLNSAGSVVNAEVKPTAASANTTFLTALVPTPESAWATRPTVKALDAKVPDAGLTVTEGTTSSSAIFNDLPEQRRVAGGLVLTGLSGVVRYEGTTPTRALLVRGTSLADASRTLLSQGSATGLLEADGLNTETLRLSGTALSTPRVHAPRATRVLWNGADVPFQREGDAIVVGKGAQTPSAPPSPPVEAEPSPQVDPDTQAPLDSDSEPVEGSGAMPPPFHAPEPSFPGASPDVPSSLSCAVGGGGELVLAWSLLALGGVLAHRRRRRP
jgi:MYXO-CTERM domain-containing protein